MRIDPLSDLALKYCTDKGAWAFAMNGDRPGMVHGYTQFYGTIFASRRAEALNVLDIGGDDNGTLMWNDYWVNSQLYLMYDYRRGIDTRIEKTNIVPIPCDIEDEAAILDQLSRLGIKFDIICYDVGHHPKREIRTLLKVMPFVNPGFQYIIEKVETGSNHEIVEFYEINKMFPYLSETEWLDLKSRITAIFMVETRPHSKLLYIV